MPDNPTEPARQDAVLRELRQRSRRGFTLWMSGLAGGFFGIGWLATRPTDDAIPWPLRYMLRFNETVSRKWLGTGGRAPEFASNQAREPRVNGRYGLSMENVDVKNWRLQVSNEHGKSVEFTLDDIKRLPRHEQVTELKCIEGWSEITHWAGCRLSDLLDLSEVAIRSGEKEPVSTSTHAYSYVAISTRDGGYYVGLDLESAVHPQTLLAYDMNWQPLTPGHGAPLRLVIPVKYGIKNIKQIASIRLSDDRPPDFWAERGYDWFAGL